MDRYDELEDATLGMTPEQTLAFLLPHAEAGDAAAQCLLADAYDDHTFGPRNPVESVAWYRKSAAQGYLRAQFYLGSMIHYGIGVGKDIHEAVHWFRLAAEKGDCAAQFRLGEILAKGEIDLPSVFRLPTGGFHATCFSIG